MLSVVAGQRLIESAPVESAVQAARRLADEEEILVEVLPLSQLSPFPSAQLRAAAARCERVLAVCRHLRRPISRGASAARNHGFRPSRGAHVWFMDDDDYATQPTVADALRAIGAGSGARILLMPRSLVLEETAIERRVAVGEADKFERYRRFGIEVTILCALFPRAVLEQLDGWDETLRALQDADLFLRAAKLRRRLAAVRRRGAGERPLAGAPPC
jgi:Glycosyl transferase family 2